MSHASTLREFANGRAPASARERAANYRAAAWAVRGLKSPHEDVARMLEQWAEVQDVIADAEEWRTSALPNPYSRVEIVASVLHGLRNVGVRSCTTDLVLAQARLLKLELKAWPWEHPLTRAALQALGRKHFAEQYSNGVWAL